MSKGWGLPEPEEDLDTLASFDKVYILECLFELLIYFHVFTHDLKSINGNYKILFLCMLSMPPQQIRDNFYGIYLLYVFSKHLRDSLLSKR